MASRRFILTAALATALAASPALAALPPAAQQSLDKVQDWLRQLKTLQATFVQIAPDGAFTTGRLWIQRPGSLRMQYDPPAQILLVTTDWRLVFYDAKSKQVNYIPVAQTPLGFMLADDPDFGKDVLVKDVKRRGGEIIITAVRRGQEDQGSVELVFAEQPVELRRWTVNEPGKQRTVVTLSDIQLNGKLDQDLFTWRDPQLFGYPKLD